MPDEYPPYPGPDTPPDDDLATDPWGWLYRDEPATVRRDDTREPHQPAPAEPDSTQFEPTQFEPTRPDPGEDPPPQPTFVAPGTAAGAAAAGAADAATAFVPDEQEPERRRKGGWLVAIIVGALALVAILIVIVVLVFRSLGGPPGTMPYQGASASSPASSGGQQKNEPTGPPTYDGNVAPIAATGASAKCVAGDAEDGAGNTVTYVPGNVTDEDPATAWRCDGDGVNQSISVQLPKDSTVARVGLINGYAKVDPKSHEQRYPEYRRITKVRWTFSNGATFDQQLSDGVQAVQHMNIPLQKGVDGVRVTIVSSTDPGQSDSSRDAVLISTIQVGKPA